MEILIRGKTLTIKDEKDEIFIGAVGGQRFKELFDAMKLLQAKHDMEDSD